MEVTVIGAGPGNISYYTGEAIESIRRSDIVLTSKRFIPDMERLNSNVVEMGVMDSCKYINEHCEDYVNLAVVASGDVGFYSIASTIKKNCGDNTYIRLVNGLSSYQYFMAKIGLSYENAKLVSLHGRDGSIVPYVSYNPLVFSLTGGNLKVANILGELVESGLGDLWVYIGERLSAEDERISMGKAVDLIESEYDELSVMVVHNENYVNCHNRLKDEDFIRGKSPMTKYAVRALTVDMLDINPKDVIYDIGAGTGSVSIAMAYKAYEGKVYALEKNSEAIPLIKSNIKKLGSYNVEVIESYAPEGMKHLPKPDKVFIGGSTGQLKNIIEICLEKNPFTDVVVNAVTLETIAEVTNVFKELDFETEVLCVNIANSQKLGRYNLMKAENPVYIIKGVRLDD